MQGKTDLWQSTETPLSGEMPNEVRYLSGLKQFVFPKLELKGEVLPLLSAMPNLQLLSLTSNKFTGSIPATFAEDHPNLEIMELTDNAFEGGIPSSIGTIASLQSLVLAKNAFAGQIPASFGSSSTLSKSYILQVCAMEIIELI